MDIFSKTPTIAEDTIIYTLYPPPGTDKAGVTSLSALIATHVREAFLPPNHIWHRDAFDLHVIDASSHTPDVLSHIQGTVRVGDCVDDEWCIVWLLDQISQKFDVVISVYDSDGEFLLIEAAEHLPNWVTPDNAENRVWIYQSRLHLIPLEHLSPPSAAKSHPRRKLPRHPDSDNDEDEESGVFISLALANQLVRNPQAKTVASDAVQAAIQRKIGRYPQALRQHVHVTKAYVPSDIVLALSQSPALVQKAVEAFYTRDALQLRVVAKMSRFPPSTSVLASVSMTRTGFAQLMGQRFHPPKVFGRWTEPESSPEWRWKDVGMKVACGFEMLYAENKSRATPGLSATPESIEALKDTLKRDTAYQTYLENLKRAGFFPVGVLEGSQEWQERESRAVKMWVEVRKDENINRPSFTALVDAAIAGSKAQSDAIIAEKTSNIEEDSTDWLNVSPEDLEKTLAGTTGKMEVDASASGVKEVGGENSTAEDAEARKQTEKLSRLAAKVESFVEGKGDLEGARFEDDLLSDDEEDFELSDDHSSESDAEEEEEDSDTRRQRALDALVQPLDPSEYGRIPPLEEKPIPSSTSQKTVPVTMETETRTLANGETRKIRQPILMRDRFDGVDSDDSDSEEDGGEDAQRALDAMKEGDESDDEAPQVVGGISHDIDINMEEEEEEFLKFSREALGITDVMWDDIVKERKGRGAFVPTKPSAAPAVDDVPELSSATEANLKGKTNKFLNALKQPELPKISEEVPRLRNPNLDSFEAVMEAMETELEKSRQARKESKSPASSPPKSRAPPPSSKGKGKAVEVESESDEDEEEDEQAMMDAELRAALRRNDQGDADDEEAEEAGMDYNLIKNFLESFQSQMGLSGPVGNLAARLEPGWTMPRDESS